MAEQRPEAEPQPAVTPAAPPPAADGARGTPLLPFGPEANDDAPTIISKNHRPPRADDGFGATLRGRRLAHFELIEPIGVGGMAAVIRARDTQLDRTVALKILPPEMAVDPENVRRFHQEARAAAKLDHENIARVFYCGEDQGLHFIAFEFVEGENLRTLLDRRGRIPVPDAIRYMLDVANGLEHSSARGVVHRDIKPSNIIITPRGRAKLVDMGLARSMEPHTDHGLTQSGVTLGTFDYISPEQALEPREADVRSDIYSLGCTFYHMMTGQPPVPEGTAAKKLHHHQHVAPIDPRQLNPDIPDEVAAVLGRMMAKDPKDRYQRPEELFTHLLQLAHKLGAVAEVPQELLLVDAPLPRPPRTRPVLVGLGLLCLVLALMLVQDRSRSPRLPPGPGPGSPPTKDPGPDLGKQPSVVAEVDGNQKASQPTRTASPPARKAEVRTAQELDGVLKEWSESDAKVTKGEVTVLNDLDLQEGLNHPVVLGAKPAGVSLTIRGPADRRPTLRLSYDTKELSRGEADWTAFTVQGGTVTFRHLRLEVKAWQADLIMAAVRVQPGGHAILDDCEIVQVGAPADSGTASDQGRLSSLIVEGGVDDDEGEARLTLKQCSFLAQHDEKTLSAGGRSAQDAVAVSGRARVEATDCAFGPHTVLVHLQKGAKKERTRLQLSQCVALLADGAAFGLDDGAGGQADVRSCLFSHPGAVGTANLIRQAGAVPAAGAAGGFYYRGKDNRYHDLTAFWVGDRGDTAVTDWDDFRKLPDQRVKEAPSSRLLAASPWLVPEPLALLQKGKLRETFKLRENVPELRQTDDRNALVGPRSYPWGEAYGQLPPPPGDERPAARIVVDPRPDAPVSDTTFHTLNEAVERARSGDEIWIRCDGLLETRQVQLDGTKAVTIKPVEGMRPVLVLAQTIESETSLFRVQDSRGPEDKGLVLENLEFRLRPAQAGVKDQAVVRLVGDGACTLRNCVATMAEPQGASLALVSVADPGTTYIKMPGQPAAPAGTPRIRLENCFVRGEGDLVAARSGRPFALDVEDSLVALAGSFLNIEGGAKNGAPVVISLTRVTAYVTNHVIRLAADRDGKVPPAVQVKGVSGCLFAPAGGKALVHLQDLDMAESQMKQLFRWEEARRNAYGNFSPMLDQVGRGDMMASPTYRQPNDWLRAFPEQGSLFPESPVRFKDPPELPLVKALPRNFEPADPQLREYGAPLPALPKPTVERLEASGTGDE